MGRQSLISQPDCWEWGLGLEAGDSALLKGGAVSPKHSGDRNVESRVISDSLVLWPGQRLCCPLCHPAPTPAVQLEKDGQRRCVSERVHIWVRLCSCLVRAL